MCVSFFGICPSHHFQDKRQNPLIVGRRIRILGCKAPRQEDQGGDYNGD